MRKCFGNVGSKKKDLMDGIRELDSIAKGQPLTEVERLRKENISMKLERFILPEGVSWRQKSRALWLREGDKNINFFHWVANSYRKNNSVDFLIFNGSITSDSREIKE
jgi:hypothetical protein